MNSTTCRIAVTLLATAPAMLLAQVDWRPIDGPSFWDAGATFDIARNRVVVLDMTGATREWDGQSWLLRPAQGPTGAVRQLVYEPLRRLVYGCGLLGADASVFAWDGTSWRPQIDTGRPSPRDAVAFAYDTNRDVLVAFGGRDSSGVEIGETWEWDAFGWHQRSPVLSPPARFGASIAFDSVRGVTVLQGGTAPLAAGSGSFLSDTWEWNGALWTPRVLGISPPGTRYVQMTFDSARARCVLPVSNAVWEYDGISWFRVSAPGMPASIGPIVFDPAVGRSILMRSSGEPSLHTWNGAIVSSISTPNLHQRIRGASIEREPLSGRCIMIGGEELLNGGRNLDTLVWQNGAWTRLPVATPLPWRQGAIVWCDATYVWVLGGYDSAGMLEDLWRWDGTNWLQMTGAAAPPTGAVVGAYDFFGQRAIVMCERGPLHVPETWRFDGATWQQLLPAHLPPGAVGEMAFDLPRGKMVLFRGMSATDHLWEWDGVDWRHIAATSGPTSANYQQGDSSLHYDLALGLVLVEGGFGRPAIVWRWDGANWSQVGLRPMALQVAVTATRALLPTLLHDGSHLIAIEAQPPVAETIGFPCRLGPRLSARTAAESGAAGFGFDLLGDAGAPLVLLGGTSPTQQQVLGCELRVVPSMGPWFAVGNSSGFATIAMPIPRLPSLVGLDFWFQGVQLPFGFQQLDASAGLRLRVGQG